MIMLPIKNSEEEKDDYYARTYGDEAAIRLKEIRKEWAKKYGG